jgi:hypothetical protein
MGCGRLRRKCDGGQTILRRAKSDRIEHEGEESRRRHDEGSKFNAD